MDKKYNKQKIFWLIVTTFVSTIISAQDAPGDNMSAEHDNYWQAIMDVAESIVTELNDAEPDEDQDELLVRLLDEHTDQHDYVIRDDLQIQTLQRSQSPCAALSNGTLGRYVPGDNFPFAAFAADAFAADVAHKVKLLLGKGE